MALRQVSEDEWYVKERMLLNWRFYSLIRLPINRVLPARPKQNKKCQEDPSVRPTSLNFVGISHSISPKLSFPFIPLSRSSLPHPFLLFTPSSALAPLLPPPPSYIITFHTLLNHALTPFSQHFRPLPLFSLFNPLLPLLPLSAESFSIFYEKTGKVFDIDLTIIPVFLSLLLYFLLYLFSLSPSWDQWFFAIYLLAPAQRNRMQPILVSYELRSTVNYSILSCAGAKKYRFSFLLCKVPLIY